MTTYVTHDGANYVCYESRIGVDRRFLGCSHETPRQAIDHKRDGSTASRPSDLTAGSVSEPDERLPEAPIASSPSPDPVAAPDAAAAVRTCVVCDRPLPPGSRSHRRTDSEACRKALGRLEGGDAAKAYGAATTANRRAAEYGLPGRISREDILELWERQPECVTCGKGRGVDHVTPMDVGGANDPTNLQTMCQGCNSRKAASERLSARGAAEIRRRADARSGVPVSHTSRPSDAAAVPTSSEAPDGYALSGASRDAGPLVSPGPPGPVVPTRRR